MSDSFTTVTTQSWGSRIKGALSGIIVGLIMFGISFPLLWWNEGRTVERHRALQEGAGIVVSVSSNEIDPGNEGKLAHTSGTATSQETLTDPEFGISAEQALRLFRNVEMYQWQEKQESKTEKNVGGSETTTTTYRYSKGWSNNLVNSSHFKKSQGHQNPATMPFDSKIQHASQVQLGKFTLTQDQVGSLSNSTSINIANVDFTGKPFNSPGRPFQVTGNILYIGRNPNSPEIGDLKIGFSKMPATPASIIGKQQNGGFTEYLPEAGSSILLIERGTQTAEAMFKSAEETNTMIAWGIRLGGFLLMFIGIRLVFRPLSVIGDVIPFIGSMIAFGTGTIAFIIALPLTLLTIAIAWIAYRPLLAGALIIAAVGSFAVPYWMKRGKVKAAAPPPPPPGGSAVQR